MQLTDLICYYLVHWQESASEGRYVCTRTSSMAQSDGIVSASSGDDLPSLCRANVIFFAKSGETITTEYDPPQFPDVSTISWLMVLVDQHLPDVVPKDGHGPSGERSTHEMFNFKRCLELLLYTMRDRMIALQYRRHVERVCNRRTVWDG